MPKAKKTAKKSEVVLQMDAVTDALKKVEVPTTLKDRFNPQIVKVRNRLWKIAENLGKAIELEATKGEREAKKAERKAKRIEKLTKQITAGQEKLEELQKKS